MIFKFKFEISLNARIKKLPGQSAALNQSEKEEMSKDLAGDSVLNSGDKTECIESSVPTDRYLNRLKSWCRTVNELLASVLAQLNSLSARLECLKKQFVAIASIIVLMVDITGGLLLGSSPGEIMQWLNSLPDASQ